MNTQEQAMEEIRRLAPKGSTIFTVLRAVSSSGTSRVISAYVIHKGHMFCLDGYIAAAKGYQIKRMGKTGEGLYIRGTGMDMGFWLVYNLGLAVHNDG